MDDDDRSASTRTTFATSSTARSSLPPLMMERRQRGRVTGIHGVRTTMDMNAIALLSLLKTKAERLEAITRIASFETNIDHYIQPEPPIVLNNEFGVSEWQLKKDAIAARSTWIHRFDQKLDTMKILERKPKPDELRAERILKSGWQNIAVHPGEMEQPARSDRGSIDAVLAPVSAVDEESKRHLFCAVCWLAVPTTKSVRVSCTKCFTVAHSWCLMEPFRSRSCCSFCEAAFLADVDRDEVSFLNQVDVHKRLNAVIKLQAFFRGRCKRLWFVRIERALRTVQRKLRQRLFYATRARHIRETRRPIRLRIHELIVFGSMGTGKDAKESSPLILNELEKSVANVTEEIGAISAAYYGQRFAWDASKTQNSDDDSEAVQILKIGHRTAPQHAESPPPAQRYPKGGVFLTVTANESENNERTFPIDGFNIVRGRFARPTREESNRKLKQICRVDLPLDALTEEDEVVELQGKRVRCRRFSTRSGDDYLLFPHVTAMTEVTFSVLQVKEWPRCEILAQSCLNLQSLQKRKQVAVFISYLGTNPALWCIPQVGEENQTKMTISERRGKVAAASSAAAIAAADYGIARVGGALTWSVLTHTDESPNQAGHLYFHSGPSRATAKKKLWSLLIDRVLLVFVGRSSKPRKIIDMARVKATYVGDDEPNLVRIKTPLESLFVASSSAISADQKNWARKLVSQSQSV